MDAWYPKAGKKYGKKDLFWPKEKDWLTIFVGIIALCMVVQLFANVALVSATLTLKDKAVKEGKK